MAPFRGLYGQEQLAGEGQSILDLLMNLIPTMQAPGTGGLFDAPLQPDPYSPGSDAARRRDPIGPYAPLVVGRPETPYPPRIKKRYEDRIPEMEAPATEQVTPYDPLSSIRAPVQPAPYAGTGGAPGGAYNPQDTTPPVDIPATEGAPPIGGTASPEPGASNMDALMQALAGLQPPPSRPPVGVATPPPPRAAPGGGGDLLAALLAMGGMRGGGPPPLAGLIR